MQFWKRMDEASEGLARQSAPQVPLLPSCGPGHLYDLPESPWPPEQWFDGYDDFHFLSKKIWLRNATKRVPNSHSWVILEPGLKFRCT